MSAPAKEIKFEGNRFYYLRNKHNILLYTGYTSRENYRKCILVVLYDPDKNTYYVLHMIVYRVDYSIWDDVDDDEYFDTINLEDVNRMAYPVSKSNI